MEYTNELIHETSPYLLQHAHNPVNWHAWNDKVLEKARADDKMLLISIGYAACHWCHVMAHESFENKEVADYMNEHFVCIKVDREERPDVDKIYMAAAQMINGNGGWPLNALALPDGKPFFAGTFFPTERWMDVLRYFTNEYAANRKELERQAADIAAGINKISEIPLKEETSQFTENNARTMFEKVGDKTDKKFGGLASRVKFPMPSVWEWVLEYYHLFKDDNALNIAELTLDRMRDGGIYDQIGGGFARYSTDSYWHVPHFEKMLYDNAQFISLYTHAWQLTGKASYKETAEGIIEFLRRDLSDGVAFYASLDADSEGEEGKYYAWTYDEVQKMLGKDVEIFCQYYGIIPGGNWQKDKNIPDRNWGKQTSKATTIDSSTIRKCRQRLLEQRSRRIPPSLDNKVLAGWNAMTSSALIDAARAFNNHNYGEMAKRNLNFLIDNLWDDTNQMLYRNFQNGERATTGFLDDYAFFVKALIDLYQYCFDINYLRLAEKVTDIILENFSDDKKGMLYYNDIRFNTLIARSRELDDNVLPAPNSVMAGNLFSLGTLTDNRDFVKLYKTMVQHIRNEMFAAPTYYGNWGRMMLKMIKTPFEVAITGKDLKTKAAIIQQRFLPEAVFCGSTGEENLPLLQQRFVEGKTMIYVCQNMACRLPVEDAEKAIELMEQKAGF